MDSPRLSLQIRPGEFVAFVGDSGCGKSTLLRLLLGFERCTSGTIYYDGQDINALDLRLVRRQMGVVLQVSRVMPTDIFRNIVGVSTRTDGRCVGRGGDGGVCRRHPGDADAACTPTSRKAAARCRAASVSAC